ncbi:sarcosine oxidase subunit gamma [Ruegeria sp. Ofav3-42]|uniref:sarcosine oxidase subunit gamma n=1 Tax=Ruegeria sp. Ofav3-42 TaxID=2917759 RepID=UPI001EF5E6DF|nr:sarcosine oxidase subunit gamma family protein [Ruegeria sp. Ofav3-42]MCG7522530.1 hypothetical protein [Ruegeria sp. Ofav3-42]
MAEMLSPLHTKAVPGRYGAAGNAGVTLSTRPIANLWQIAGWQGFGDAAAPVLAALGLTDGGSYRRSEQSGEVTAWRIAPDKILIEGAGDLSAHTSDDLVTLDLGHARAAITLSGPAARDLLMQLSAVDCTPSAFGLGEFMQTGIHHVGVLIQCTGPDNFDVLVPGTWAETVWEVLHDNALPHGLNIDEAA